MDKFTLFELHVHDGMEFSATNTAPAIGRSDDDERDEAVDAAGDDDRDHDESEGRAVGSRGLLVGLVFLVALAVVVRTLRGGGADLEVAELDDLSSTDDEAEAEH